MIYDIECYTNFFSITLKEGKRVYQYVLFNDTELKMTKEKLINLIKNQTLIGFNSLNYDDVLLNYFIETPNVLNSELRSVNDAIIKSTNKTIKKVKSKYVKFTQVYKSIDLYERSPLLRSSLKAYEHYKRLKNISETPVHFDADVKEEEIPLILKYNLDDVLATEMLYKEVLPLLDSLDDLSTQYNVDDLKSLSSGQIVDTFFRTTINPEKVPNNIVVDLKQNIDFTIQDPIVLEHLDKIQNYTVKEYSFHDIKSEFAAAKPIDRVKYDIERECETSFSATILNANIQFGIGGLHSEVEPLNLVSNDEYTIIDCDVNGMYPNVTIKQKLTPFYFSSETKDKFLKTYQEIIDKRNQLKSEGSTLEESYKLIANTLTGKFKEIYSALYDSSCHVKICTYGQYFLFSVLEQVQQYVDTICQVNTDGFTLYVKREYVKEIENILNNTGEIKWKTKHFKKFVSKDCNNYLALTNEDEVKTKGAAFNLKTYNIPQITKQALINYLLFDIQVEKTITECKDIYDFLYFSKPSKASLTIDDVEFSGKVIRFYKSLNGKTIKSNGKQISNGDNVIEQNQIDQSKLSDVDLQFYINDAKKLINTIKGNEHNDVVNLFSEFDITLCGKTPTKAVDGIILYKGNANKGPNLYSYETVGIDMIEHPELLYVDIDHIAPEHRIMIDMCKNANTIYSTSDTNEDSYRFFFKNQTDIQGRYVWFNDKNETSLEIWNRVKNKVSVSGVKKKTISGEVLEHYIVKGETLKPLTQEIYDWIKANPPKKVTSIDKAPEQKTIQKSNDFNENMINLFNVIKDKYDIKLATKSGTKYFKFDNPPNWYIQTGGWRDGTLVVFPKTFSKTFDINIVSKTTSFSDEDIERLYNELKVYFNEPEQSNVSMTIVDDFWGTPITTSAEDFEELFDDEDNNILERTPLIPTFVYDNLPNILKELCSKFSVDREKDILLTSTLTTLSCLFPNCSGRYWYDTLYANIYTLLISGAGNSKGVGKFAFDLTKRLRDEMHNDYLRKKLEFETIETNKKLDPPKEVTLKIAGNSSAAVFMQKLLSNNGSGLIHETEADAMVNAFSKEWGNYDENLRKAFQHEYIHSDRLTYNVQIETPKLSIYMSGTPQQMNSLIKSSENGLFSRFLYYIFKGKREMLNPFKNNKMDYTQYFQNKSHDIFDIYTYYLDNPVNVTVTDEQGEVFFQRINNLFNDLKIKHDGEDIDSAVKRLGTMAFKLLIQLSCIRNYENKKKYDGELNVTDLDIEIVFQLIETYAKHMEIVYVNLERKDNMKIKGNPKEKWQNQILSQTGNFTKPFAVALGKNLNISERSIGYYLKELIDSKKLGKESKFLYKVIKK